MALYLTNLFPMLNIHILPTSLCLASCAILLACSFVMMLNKRYATRSPLLHLQSTATFLISILKIPTLFLLTIYGIFHFVSGIQFYFHAFKSLHIDSLSFLLDIAEFMTCFWVTFNFLAEAKSRLIYWSAQKNHTTFNIVLPHIEKSLDSVLVLIMVNLLIPLLDLTGLADLVVDRAAQILLITMIAFFFFQLVSIFEKIIESRYIANNTDIFSARKINTQLLILKRLIIVLISIVALAYILMLFDKVSSLGKGLLTTAGIISAVGAFASQQSLSRIFAGLQIAFSQPVRIGDTVIIENEFGTIEEITLLYIVVKLWDLRRLILPTDYFTSKGIQNLTRQSSQLLGTIFLYADYTLPVDEVRKKFLALLHDSPLWDKKVAVLHVTNVSEKALELRLLASAKDADTLWELRCAMREQVMNYIVTTYPWCLSQARNLNTQDQPMNRNAMAV